jgi:hypothetical protein
MIINAENKNPRNLLSLWVKLRDTYGIKYSFVKKVNLKYATPSSLQQTLAGQDLFPPG